MWWWNRSAALASLVLVISCARLNPTFGDGDTEGETDGDAASSTVGTTRGSESDVVSDTRDADSDSNTNSSETAGQTTGMDTTTAGATTGGETSDTSEETDSDTEEPVACTVVPGPTALCNTINQGCQGGTCAPWSSEEDGELEGTFCLPAGTLMDGDRCDPICTAMPDRNCGPGLVCDIYSGPPQCRPTCPSMPLLGCETGICLRYAWEEKDGGETATPLSFCKGECDPASDELANTCEGGESCVLDEGFGTVCVPEEEPVEQGGDCTANECALGLICVPSELEPDCEHEACCYEACSFAAPICPVGNCMITIDVPFADEISVGFCPPP